MHPPRTILVATDFSDCAERALDYAVSFADTVGAKIYLLNVIGVPTLGLPELGVALTTTMMESTVRTHHAELDRLAGRRPGANIEPMLRTGDAREVIIDVARDVHADLIAMGTHGRRGVRRALIGSIAEGVVRAAPCPVLTVREQKA
ncbi:MAG TPA: universal stress protein [Kofleriaceae bacterium]|jgi:nucleotide-binding universal stress UspA family protein